MNDAIAEGEEFINDFSESQLLTLIQEKQFPAIRFWLTHRHPKYKKPIEETPTQANLDSNAIIKEMGLTAEDFTDEKVDETNKRVFKYLRNQ